jgi:RHS repeat-associated protein
VDHLNTPRLVADANQNAVWKWENQEPFGNNPADENPSALGAFDLPLRLPGQRNDTETGLHYNYFRDYDPTTGRYFKSDPLGLVGGLNTYLYVANPLQEVDPEGVMGNAPGSGPYAPGTGPGISLGQIYNNVTAGFATTGSLTTFPYCKGDWGKQIRFTRDFLWQITLNCTCWWSCHSCPPHGDAYPDPNLGQYPSPGKLLYSGTAVNMGKAQKKGDACQCAKPGPEKGCCN